jgi:hypothetical protein
LVSSIESPRLSDNRVTTQVDWHVAQHCAGSPSESRSASMSARALARRSTATSEARADIKKKVRGRDAANRAPLVWGRSLRRVEERTISCQIGMRARRLPDTAPADLGVYCTKPIFFAAASIAAAF